MIDAGADLGAIDELRRAVSHEARRGLKRAMRSESYRLLRVMRARLRAGVGPERAPLTRALSRYGGRRALARVAPMTAYDVRPAGFGWEARIGPGAGTTRRKRVPARLLEEVVRGRRVRVTRERQRAIARSLRRRGKRTKRLRLPREGRVLVWPRRDYPTEIARAEARRSAANVARLYGLALRGERWGRDWWKGA